MNHRTHVPGALQALTWPLWDFATIYRVESSHYFFEKPVGVASSTLDTKNYCDTNLHIPGQLYAGNSFLLHGIRVAFFPNIEGLDVSEAKSRRDLATMGICVLSFKTGCTLKPRRSLSCRYARPSTRVDRKRACVVRFVAKGWSKSWRALTAR